jgi:hypothetical protein
MTEPGPLIDNGFVRWSLCRGDCSGRASTAELWGRFRVICLKEWAPVGNDVVTIFRGVCTG